MRPSSSVSAEGFPSVIITICRMSFFCRSKIPRLQCGSEKFGFTAIDASEEIHIQQAKVRNLIREKIDLPYAVRLIRTSAPAYSAAISPAGVRKRTRSALTRRSG